MGNDTPNLANYYLVQDKNFRFSPKAKGRPFLWVQRICGLEFLPRKVDTPPELSLRDIDIVPEEKHDKSLDLNNIINAIQQRVVYAQSLQSQLDQLVKGKIPVEIKASLPVRNLTSLVSWSEVDADSYYRRRHRRSSRPTTSNTPKEEGEVEEGEVEMTDNTDHQDQISLGQSGPVESREDELRKDTLPDYNRYFRAIFECEKDTYKARILVSPCYPHVVPVFKLSMKSHKNKHVIPAHIKMDCDPEAFLVATKSTSSHTENINIKHIQTELNLNYKTLLSSEKDIDRILSYQLRRLKVCLDVLCEVTKKGCDSSSAKIMGRPFRGRDRRIVFL